MSAQIEKNHQNETNVTNTAEASSSETYKNGATSLTLKGILQQVAERENLHDYELVLTNTSDKGDGYVGLINFCQVKGTTAEGKPMLLDLVVKSAPEIEKLRADVPVRNAFQTENYIYWVIHPKLKQIQKEYNISEPFDSMAKCFLIIEDECQEALVLQNLKAEGYGLWDKKKPMNEEHVTCVMKQYGKFHALSFALRLIDEEAFLKLASGLKYNVVNEFLEKSEKSLLTLLDKLVESFDEGKDGMLIERLLKFKSSLLKFLMEEITKTDQYSVISHGDCWTNNMMFRYENEKLTDVCLLDWQCSRLTSPAVDLVYFFYCCSPNDIINKLDHYLKIYHDSFSAMLSQFDFDANQLFPKSKLEEHWKLFSKFGLVMATVALKVMVSDSDEVVDFKDTTESGLPPDAAFMFETKHQDEYLRRMHGILRHLFERGIL